MQNPTATSTTTPSGADGDTSRGTSDVASKVIAAPLFLVGAERSGTTLLQLMLDHHPAVAFPGEFDFLVKFLPEAGSFPTLEEYYGRLATSLPFSSRNLSIDRSLDYAALANSFLLQERARAGKECFGVTVHGHVDRLLRIWPDARFIHLVRDPRDVAASCVVMGWAGNVWTGVGRWKTAESAWEALLRQLPAGRSIELRFEDLVRDAPAELTRLCEFVGVAYSGRMLRYPEDTTYGPIDPGMAAKWRDKLSDREVRLVEARVGDLLEKRGYEPSGLDRLEVGGLERSRLKLQDRLYRVRFRIRRYGWRLFLAGAIANRLGLRGLKKTLTPRFHAIDREYLK